MSRHNNTVSLLFFFSSYFVRSSVYNIPFVPLNPRRRVHRPFPLLKLPRSSLSSPSLSLSPPPSPHTHTHTEDPQRMRKGEKMEVIFSPSLPQSQCFTILPTHSLTLSFLLFVGGSRNVCVGGLTASHFQHVLLSG